MWENETWESDDVWSEGHGRRDSDKRRKGFTNSFAQKLERNVCHPESVSLSICCVFWMVLNPLKFSSFSQEKILGFSLGVLEGEGVLFHLTFLVFKLEDFQHPGVRLKRLSLGSLGAYQKSMAWRMEKVSKM